MLIGIPKEILDEEKRVAALPETVARLVGMGFEVVVESSAGGGVFRTDAEYEAAGARIEPDVHALYERADIILKVKQPCMNHQLNRHEAEMIRPGSMLICFLHPAAPANQSVVRTLRERRVTSLTMDGIPRISRAQTMDALTSMSTVTGYRSVLLAASHFPRFVPMMGTAIGSLPPAQFLIIGTGVVGLQAIATVKRLGGVVKAVDIRAEARKEASSLKGTQVVGFEVPDELAHGEGGYARALPKEWLERERELLRSVVPQTDIIILCALVPGEVAPVLITRDMIASMKPGSVVVDVSVDQGGNCELTEPGRVITVNNVTICGTANIPGSMAVDATWLYAHNMLHFMENLFPKGPGPINQEDEIVRHTLVTIDGRIVHRGTLKAMGEA
ncbi:MAG TPA: NAD(P) transhydrogenase subunit alpha [Phycisphaerae bacterium]|nr:NAD(P) transhydrogenase subunit alpha [Phycisphaerae bacterium]HOM50108.1 NAD(P) transhydrogenase subunit alpha [Phycisphaerae bacterium]HOQ86650.1 NAD(P) transhydrogenase subunit alpha [Phycisphaerae bacterium]HPP26589.1 NAD(P) transhydrogenase subunit alpha [Phycisphaerae bacterium]HQA00310.1 NAD(P) transhydrogenase subunit alpha [Phycisphaerae bacterium]